MTASKMIGELRATKNRWEATIEAGKSEAHGLNGYPEIELSSEMEGRQACLDELSKMLAAWEAKSASLTPSTGKAEPPPGWPSDGEG